MKTLNLAGALALALLAACSGEVKVDTDEPDDTVVVVDTAAGTIDTATVPEKSVAPVTDTAAATPSDSMTKPAAAAGLGTGVYQVQTALDAVGAQTSGSDFSLVAGMPHRRLSFDALPGGNGASLIGPIDDLRIASISLDDITKAPSRDLLFAFAGTFSPKLKAWTRKTLDHADFESSVAPETTIGSASWVMRRMGNIVELRGEVE
jgi:hypothetical protein